MVFLCHAIWYKFHEKVFPSSKQNWVLGTSGTKKLQQRKWYSTKHDYASINYYIIIHCQIGHVILAMFDYLTNKCNDLATLILQTQYLKIQTSKKFKNLLPSSQCTPVKSMSLHSHAGPLSVDMQTPLFWQGFWCSQVLMVVDLTPCNNIFQKTWN